MTDSDDTAARLRADMEGAIAEGVDRHQRAARAADAALQLQQRITRSDSVEAAIAALTADEMAGLVDLWVSEGHPLGELLHAIDHPADESAPER